MRGRNAPPVDRLKNGSDIFELIKTNKCKILKSKSFIEFVLLVCLTGYFIVSANKSFWVPYRRRTKTILYTFFYSAVQANIRERRMSTDVCTCVFMDFKTCHQTNNFPFEFAVCTGLLKNPSVIVFLFLNDRVKQKKKHIYLVVVIICAHERFGAF